MAWMRLLVGAGMKQGQQSYPGVKADPYGSFSHFMGATNANILDPFDIFGQSGSNPLKNFLNPGGATLIPGMTPSNQPLPGPQNGGGAPPPGGGMMPTGMSPGQDAGLMSAYATFLRNLGAPPMRGGMGGGTPGGAPVVHTPPGQNFNAMAALSRLGQPGPSNGLYQPR